MNLTFVHCDQRVNIMTDKLANVATCPLLPLRKGILFPGTSMSIGVGRKKSLALMEALEDGTPLVVAFQRDAKVEDPGLVDLLPIGVRATLTRTGRPARGGVSVLLKAGERVEIHNLLRAHPYWEATVSTTAETKANTTEARALSSLLVDEVEALGSAAPEALIERMRAVAAGKDAGAIADILAGALGIDSDKEATVLLAADVEQRLRLVLGYLRQARAVADVKSKLSAEVQEQIGKHQRETILREQLKAIQRELGEDDTDEDELKQRIDKAELPEDARKVAEREFRRAARVGGPEQQVIRSYLELIAELPWTKRARLSEDIAAVADRLDADHFGLGEVKQRLLEHLAVEQRVKDHKGTILTLVGPPGVGKTSLGQSIAEATGRPFVRIALGGVRDEAEIRGHRRTYVGALPGRIINALRGVAVKNPLILLDEIDKLGQGWMGSPEAALLELLDPEQNKHFSDHYLELPFDLSEVLFLCTANNLQHLSAPLRDRLEVVELKGYAPHEKLSIARQHLLPRLLRRHGLQESHLGLSDEALLAIIERYTREAGVRQLTRELTRLCRMAVLRLAQKPEEASLGLVLEPGTLTEVLGKAPFERDTLERIAIPGVATGLAWTPVGGDLLYIESSRMPGKGRVEVTGQLGEVMKESAHAALSYLRSNAKSLGIETRLLDQQDVHIHVPAGGVPKDGPSAGITILAALASLFTNRLVRADTAMTGECTLRGRVLPVGGISAKVLAAHRHGVRRVILSDKNRRDVDEIPEEILKSMELVFVDDVRQVLEEALVPTGQMPSTPHDVAAASEARNHA